MRAAALRAQLCQGTRVVSPEGLRIGAGAWLEGFSATPAGLFCSAHGSALVVGWQQGLELFWWISCQGQTQPQHVEQFPFTSGRALGAGTSSAFG